tara:strand:- start:438 stop:1793 length:1356 start_codon:yes stop_codon:yes gene_type:complete
LTDSPQKIAVIGAGIAGLSAAWLLSQKYDVVVFEKNLHLGGHANTYRMNINGKILDLDTGFIVYNEINYPNLVSLFNYLNISTQNSDMSFSFSNLNTKFEYSSDIIKSLFAQKSNILRPDFWFMVLDIIQFYRRAKSDLEKGRLKGLNLGEYLSLGNYSKAFVEYHLLPMGSAIWSASEKDMKNYPAESFIRFFVNHDLLTLGKRSKWRTVKGGSHIYIKKLVNEIKKNKIVHEEITEIIRRENSVLLTNVYGHKYSFDHVVIATHADEALKLLEKPNYLEEQLLKTFNYTKNTAYLHTDKSFMPQKNESWSSWNYIVSNKEEGNAPVVTYWLNRLQNINSQDEIFVTLNPHTLPSNDLIIDKFCYNHPVFDNQALRSQKKLMKIQGIERTWFCGSYFGNGFHEDALDSGLNVAEILGKTRRPWNTDSSTFLPNHSSENLFPSTLKYLLKN